MAVLEGAENYSLADHPMNPNPGVDEPFLVQIPFEVQDLNANRQISLIMFDAAQQLTDSVFEAFNSDGNMECNWLFQEYHSTLAAVPAALITHDSLTWTTNWMKCQWDTGDSLIFTYGNPVVPGFDRFSFTTPQREKISLSDADVRRINVFPNPYYGQTELETPRHGKYVTFNHLPQKTLIRIFTIGGIHVRTLYKNNEMQQLRWYLDNQYGLAVASGLYLAQVELPDYDKQKILKIALLQAAR